MLQVFDVLSCVRSASHPPTLNSNLAKTASLKRSYEQRASTSVSVAPTGRLADTARGQQSSSNQSISGYRPHLTHSTAAPSFSGDDFSRPNKVAKTHSQVFQLSAVRVKSKSTRSTLTFIGRNLSIIMVTHKIPLPLFQQTDYRSSLLLCITYEVVLEFLQASTSTTPSVNPNSSVNPPCTPARLATNSASKVTRMNLQPLRMASNLDSTAVDVEKERVDAFLNNLVSFAYP